jgi:rhodanese-related sulfurtransferase
MVVAIALALGSWLLRSPRLPLLAHKAAYERSLAAPLLTIEQSLRFYEEGTHLFVDTRPLAGDDETRIPGSLNITAPNFQDDLRAVADFIFPEDALVLYGTDNVAEVSNVAARFQERGYENLSIMMGGIEAWQQAGGPVTGP